VNATGDVCIPAMLDRKIMVIETVEESRGTLIKFDWSWSSISEG
jgi:hypothetical protein